MPPAMAPPRLDEDAPARNAFTAFLDEADASREMGSIMDFFAFTVSA